MSKRKPCRVHLVGLRVVEGRDTGELLHTISTRFGLVCATLLTLLAQHSTSSQMPAVSYPHTSPY
jgi:hypothetical protein